jgi:hypothetical protein
MLLHLFAFFLFCQFCQAQAPGTSVGSGPDLYSNAEHMSDSSGLLIQKEYVDVGHILSCTLEVVHFTDLLRRTSFSALRFSDAQNRQAFLDADEIETLRVSMHLINDSITHTNPTNYVVANYKSRSGFKAGCYRDKGGWTPYLQLKPNDLATFIQMKKSDFDVFLKILDNVKTKL